MQGHATSRKSTVGTQQPFVFATTRVVGERNDDNADIFNLVTYRGAYVSPGGGCMEQGLGILAGNTVGLPGGNISNITDIESRLIGLDAKANRQTTTTTKTIPMSYPLPVCHPSK